MDNGMILDSHSGTQEFIRSTSRVKESSDVYV